MYEAPKPDLKRCAAAESQSAGSAAAKQRCACPSASGRTKAGQTQGQRQSLPRRIERVLIDDLLRGVTVLFAKEPNMTIGIIFT